MYAKLYKDVYIYIHIVIPPPNLTIDGARGGHTHYGSS